MSTPPHIAIGKPAEDGQELLRRRDRIVRLYANPAGKFILDYGCGNGAQTAMLSRDASLLVGMDVSHDHLLAMQQASHERVGPTPHAVLVGGTSIPSPDATFDLVVSFEVLEHVQDEQQTLSEIFRVLKPSGEFLLTVPNKWWIFETHGARLPLLPWNRVPLFSWLPAPLHRRWAHARIYRRTQIINLIRASGFEVLTSAYVTAPLDVLPPGLLQTWLRKTLFRLDTTRVPLLATAIFVHCRKPGGT